MVKIMPFVGTNMLEDDVDHSLPAKTLAVYGLKIRKDLQDVLS